MVDIMLVLLIIFMVVTPFLQQGITVAIPRDLRNPDEDQGIIKETSVVISIPNDGEYYLGKKKVKPGRPEDGSRKGAGEQEGRGQDCLYQERRRRELRRSRKRHQRGARKGRR